MQPETQARSEGEGSPDARRFHVGLDGLPAGRTYEDVPFTLPGGSVVVPPVAQDASAALRELRLMYEALKREKDGLERALAGLRKENARLRRKLEAG